MTSQELIDLVYIIVFCMGGIAFAVGPFILVYFLQPRSTRNTVGKTLQVVECGMPPIGDAWIKFRAVYSLYALMFVAFAVDILFLMPVALVYNRPGPVGDLQAFVEILIFVGILSLVIVYAGKKGVFQWQRKTYSDQ